VSERAPLPAGGNSAARLVSIQVGRVRTHTVAAIPGHDEREWRTAYFKDPAVGSVHCGRLGLDGDEQYDHAHHGGPHRAILGYAAGHYPLWRAELGLDEMGPGAFAENLTIDGQDESTVCVGDTYAIGPVRLQVSQPRGPCANISRRWQRPELLKRVADTARFGWYLRVLQEGDIAAGLAVELVERRHPELNVAFVFRLRSQPQLDPGAVARLARCPELTPELRDKFAAQLATLETRGDS
jgi:MOSC domain-containing protein YiiM